MYELREGGHGEAIAHASHWWTRTSRGDARRIRGHTLRTPVALGALLLAGALAGFLGGLSRFLGRSLSHGDGGENDLWKNTKVTERSQKSHCRATQSVTCGLFLSPWEAQFATHNFKPSYHQTPLIMSGKGKSGRGKTSSKSTSKSAKAGLQVRGWVWL